MKFNISAQTVINRPVSSVFEVISDLSKWNIWSPWYQCEPTAKVEYNGQAGSLDQSQKWEGSVIGSGKMSVIGLEKDHVIKLKLEFYKPWQSVEEAIFTIKPNGRKNEHESIVIWSMTSKLPFFMFFMKGKMKSFMQSDFDRGLKLLKEYLETGDVVSKPVYQGEQEMNAFQLVGKKRICTVQEVHKVMEKDFQELGDLRAQNHFTASNCPVAVYNKYDIPKNECEYTYGFLYNENETVKVPHGFQIEKYPAHKVLAVDFYGPYRNLGNPWAMAYSYQRSKKKKVSPVVPPYEIYKTMPGQVSEKDIYTQVVVPVK